MLGKLNVHPELDFPSGGIVESGEISLGVVVCSLREGQSRQQAAAARALLVGLIPYGISLGTSALAPCSRIFSVLLAYS